MGELVCVFMVLVLCSFLIIGVDLRYCWVVVMILLCVIEWIWFGYVCMFLMVCFEVRVELKRWVSLDWLF